MRNIASLAELQSLVGQEVAVSDWVEIDQERVNRFAEATDDRQWIHIDVARSQAESPYGGTVAHGFLTLSLLPMLMANAIRIDGVKMGLNYGLNKVRFPSPVPVGSKLRSRMTLLEMQDISGGAQVIWQVTIERQGGDKPACVAESVLRLFA